MKKEKCNSGQLSFDFTSNRDVSFVDNGVVRVFDFCRLSLNKAKKRELEIIKERVKSVDLFFK